MAGDLEFLQNVEEATVSNGKRLQTGDLWIDEVLKPDGLVISWAERIADIPQFVVQIQQQTGRTIDLIRGSASIAAPGEHPLLGDWIANGSFDEDRFVARLARELGGDWEIIVTPNRVIFKRITGS